MIGGTAVAAGLDLSLDLVQLLQLFNGTTRAAGVDAGILRQRAHRRPCTAIAVVICDADEYELGCAGRPGVVERDRDGFDAHELPPIDRF
ncbi:hypothetical protein NS234_07505 [Microbacterium oxydans]|nr:hypothetical protein [Microbacterium oxydans]KTR77442.1 hypothetical protein NS234_07505 [Microbacterium oxydans]